RSTHRTPFSSSPPPPTSPLFPYTTLFRSAAALQPSSIRSASGALFSLVAIGGFHKGPAATRMTSAARVSRSSVSHHGVRAGVSRSEEHTSELQSLTNLVCRLLLEKKKNDS